MKKLANIIKIIGGPVSALGFTLAASFNPLWLVAAFSFYLIMLYIIAITERDEPTINN